MICLDYSALFSTTKLFTGNADEMRLDLSMRDLIVRKVGLGARRGRGWRRRGVVLIRCAKYNRPVDAHAPMGAELIKLFKYIFEKIQIFFLNFAIFPDVGKLHALQA